jgi:hypothetical protein
VSAGAIAPWTAPLESRLKALLPRHWHGPRHRHSPVDIMD